MWPWKIGHTNEQSSLKFCWYGLDQKKQSPIVLSKEYFANISTLSQCTSKYVLDICWHKLYIDMFLIMPQWNGNVTVHILMSLYLWLFSCHFGCKKWAESWLYQSENFESDIYYIRWKVTLQKETSKIVDCDLKTKV